MASANAAIKSIGTKIFPVASGLRPIEAMASAPILPMAQAGTIDPSRSQALWRILIIPYLLLFARLFLLSRKSHHYLIILIL